MTHYRPRHLSRTACGSWLKARWPFKFTDILTFVDCPGCLASNEAKAQVAWDEAGATRMMQLLTQLRDA